MNKTLYFLIGFFLSFVCFSLVQADDCVDLTAFESNRSAYKATFSNLVEDVNVGHYQTQSELLTAIDTASDPQYGGTANCSVAEGTAFCQQVVNFGGEYHLWYGTYGSWFPCDSDSDGDGDGLPDDCDFYPDDPSAYSVRLLSYQADSGGNHVRECYETDRGGLFCLGADYNSGLTDTISFSSPWQSPNDICSSGSDGFKDPADGETNLPDDPNFQDGESSEDGDLDSDLLRKIVDNTNLLNNNIEVLGTYLRDQNSGSTTDLSSLSSQFSDISGAIGDLAAGQAFANSLLSSIKTDTINLLDGVNDMTTLLTGMSASLTDLNTSITDLGVQISSDLLSVSNGVNSVKTSIDAGNTTLTNIKSGIDANSTAITGVKTSVDSLKTSVDSGNGLLSDLKTGQQGISSGIADIKSNIDQTNQNLHIISDHLGVTNSHLSDIKDGISSLPTAEEIAQSIGNNLIDSNQTIDKTVTDNIPALNQTDSLTSIKVKYSDRYDLFITTLKESDLFSLPFGIFTGPSGSGASIQTVNIGKWGSATDQTATIDYSDYDNIWNILRSVLLLLTSFSCSKILILKKG